MRLVGGVGRVLVRFVHWIFALMVGWSAPIGAEELAWPLVIAPALSSSFGESRSSAFHAGIDLKTWGRTGYVVQAIDDGYIERVRTSPWGYGRAVYQRLSDGRIAVYAHLASFAEPLQGRVAEAQRAAGRYSVNLWFEAGEIPVRRGEELARSGESGAGPPHLHFELRDSDNVPINPLLNGYRVDDATAPIMRRLALVPASANDRINGSSAPVSVALRWDDRAAAFVADDTLQMHGQVGVAVEVWDRAEAATNKLAPHQLRLRVDGLEAFSLSYERIPYANAHQVLIDRIYIDHPNGTARFHALFRPLGSRLSFYQGASDGWLRSAEGPGPGFLSEGIHLLEVVANDVLGNSSHARLRVAVNQVPRLRAAVVERAPDAWVLQAEVEDGDDAQLNAALYQRQKGTWKLREERTLPVGPAVHRWDVGGRSGQWKLRIQDGKGGVDSLVYGVPPVALSQKQIAVERIVHADWLALRLKVDQLVAQQPQVLWGDQVLWARQVGSKTFEVAIPLVGANGLPAEATVVVGGYQQAVRLDQVIASPGAEQRIELADGAVALAFAANSLYRAVVPQVESFLPEPSDGLVAAGMGYALGPDSVPFDARVGVWLRCPDNGCDGAQMGLYSQGRDGQWWLVGSERTEDRMGANLRQFGRFALMRDVEPPSIRALEPAHSANIEKRRPELRALVEDRGSGIGREEDLAIELDGRSLIVEYDPEAQMVRARPDSALSLGMHEWTITVRDMGGNQRQVRGAFRIVK